MTCIIITVRPPTHPTPLYCSLGTTKPNLLNQIYQAETTKLNPQNHSYQEKYLECKEPNTIKQNLEILRIKSNPSLSWAWPFFWNNATNNLLFPVKWHSHLIEQALKKKTSFGVALGCHSGGWLAMLAGFLLLQFSPNFR